MEPLWFDSWQALGRIVLLGITGYICLVVILRLSGKRTLSKMNAFDFVVTIAFGSVFATLLLSKDTTLSEGVTALIMLTSLQYAVAWLSVRSEPFRRLVKAQPSLLFYEGEMQKSALKKERVAEAEVLAAIRTEGYRDMAQVAAVVLEADGSIHVLPKQSAVEQDVLKASF